MKTIGYIILHPAGGDAYFAITKKESLHIREQMLIAIVRSSLRHGIKWTPSDQRRLRRNIWIRRLRKVAV